MRTSRPPGSCRCNCSSPCTRCSEARRLVPASVRVSVPLPNCRRASTARLGGAVPRSYQCRRPAIMRWNTSHSSPSSPIASRLPRRRTWVTRRCSAAWMGGTAVRSTNGETICTRSRRSPTMRCCSASRYTVRSGSSGMGSGSLPRQLRARAGISVAPKGSVDAAGGSSAARQFPAGRNVERNTLPFFITNATFFSALMSASGSPATATRSAYAPGATVPSSPRLPRSSAPREVAA